MLVMTRKPGEKIYVGENVVITLVEVQRHRVRVGVDAPRDVPIYRQEILPPDAKVYRPRRA